MFERSKLTEQILEIFRKSNGMVSYERLKTATGHEIDEIRSTISNARKYLERDEGIVFGNIRGKGYKRLSDSEKAESVEGFKRKIHRAAFPGRNWTSR